MSYRIPRGPEKGRAPLGFRRAGPHCPMVPDTPSSVAPVAGGVASFLWDASCGAPQAADLGLRRSAGPGGPVLADCPRLAFLRVGFASPGLTAGGRGLLPRVFTLTALRVERPMRAAVCFLWHYPWRPDLSASSC